MVAQALAEAENKTDTNTPLANVCQRFQKLYAGVVFDYLDHHGLPHQLLSSALTPLTLEMKIAGPAFTVKGGVSTVKDETVRYKRLEMITKMTYPCVEVRDRGTPFSVALYGELSATSAKAHGAVGALIDNATRDSGFLIEMGFPVFCRGRNPIEAFGRWMMVDYQVPIRIAGELCNEVLIRPGDFIFGDLDGVLVIPHERTLEVLEECERIVGIEDIAREEFRRGDNPVEVFERHKRL